MATVWREKEHFRHWAPSQTNSKYHQHSPLILRRYVTPFFFFTGALIQKWCLGFDAYQEKLKLQALVTASCIYRTVMLTRIINGPEDSIGLGGGGSGKKSVCVQLMTMCSHSWEPSWIFQGKNPTKSPLPLSISCRQFFATPPCIGVPFYGSRLLDHEISADSDVLPKIESHGVNSLESAALVQSAASQVSFGNWIFESWMKLKESKD